jgi:hypothetical protein
VNWTTKEVYKNPNIRILETSNTVSQAASFLREQTNHIERGERLNEVMGNIKPDKPEKWTDTEIIVKRESKRKDPTIAAIGVGGATLGKRADIGILDDILDLENTRTPEQREKIKFWVDNAFRPFIEPKTGRQIVVGTVWYKGDYLDEHLADKTYDIRLQLRALIRDSKTGEGSTDEYALDIREVFSDEVIEYYGINAREGVLWPERWPMSELMLERAAMGTVAFNRQYMNIPTDETTAIFKEPWIEAAKNVNLALLDHFSEATDIHTVLIRVTGVDLAAGEKKINNESVVFTLGYTRTNKYIPFNVIKGHWTPKLVRSNIAGQANAFQSDLILVEDNATQAMLVKDMQDMTALPIRGFTTGGEKFDEYIGINSMAVTFEAGMWILPASPISPRSIQIYEEIKAALLGFPSGHTPDILMAIWFAYTGIRSLIGTIGVQSIQQEGSIYPETPTTVGEGERRRGRIDLDAEDEEEYGE